MRTSLAARVAAHCTRYGLLPAGRPVLAMVSGGADSTCLMHLLAGLHDGPVHVLSVDHGLRPEAAGEAQAVARAAAALGLDARVVTLSLSPGAGVAERARDARLATARSVAAELGCQAIATGHTASDQAETVLFRLARGTGRTGALGIAPRAGDLVRPLLAVTAEETRAWCAGRGLAVVEDPSNADPRAARARVRHGALPVLRTVNGAAERHLAAFADTLRDEAAVLDALVDGAWARCAVGEGLVPERLSAEASALRPLLVRRLLAGAGLPGEAMASGPVARVLDLAARGGMRTEVPGGIVLLERGALVAEPAAAEAAPAAAPLGVPGRVRFGGLVVEAGAGVAEAPTPTRVPLTVDGPLVVRSPRAGDRLPLPGGGRQAVGRLLAAAGVPARRRHLAPVVTAGDRVAWVAGVRAAPDLIAAPGEEAVVLTVVPA